MKAKYAVRIVLVIGVLCALLVLFMRGCQGDAGQTDDPAVTDTAVVTDAPDATPTPPPITDVYEATDSRTNDAGLYHNGKVFTAKDKDGANVTAGIKDDSDKNCIYLNLRHENACHGWEIGYYIDRGHGYLMCSTEASGMDCDSGTNAGYSNFYIPGRCWDDIVPSAYKSETDFGLKWTDDAMNEMLASGTVMHIRAVSLKTRELLGVFDLEITYNEKDGYSITSFASTEVTDPDVLSQADRDAIIAEAIQFADDEFIANEADEDWKEYATENAVIDKVTKPYFNRFLDARGFTAKPYEYSHCKDTFAVTIPIDTRGYLTMYFAPSIELMGLDSAILEEMDGLDLEMYGYDPVQVYKASLLEQTVPEDFIQN